MVVWPSFTSDPTVAGVAYDARGGAPPGVSVRRVTPDWSYVEFTPESENPVGVVNVRAGGRSAAPWRLQLDQSSQRCSVSRRKVLARPHRR